MSNEVQFDVDQIQRPSFEPKEPTPVRLLLKYSGGFIKDEEQANYVLVTLVVIVLAVSFYIFSSTTNIKLHELTPEQLQQMEDAKRLHAK